jgi:hypothetical protein
MEERKKSKTKGFERFDRLDEHPDDPKVPSIHPTL